MHCWGMNPVVTAKLQLNGQDRFSEREGSTSLGSNLTKPTPEHLMKVSMCTLSLSALKSTNQAAHATSLELITPHFNWSCLTPQLKAPRLPRSVSMPPTTTFSVS
jgi:hypothetical protein